MVKRQKEKQYLAATENKRNAKLRSGTAQAGSVVQRKLPFNCCALTLTPFTNPVCNQSGVVFENSALMEFLIHNNNKDPVTGKSLQSRAIIQLHMDKDEEGRWQCPVLTKPFSDHTKIVAILTKSKKEAYVYSFEAYNELNVKAKNWLDLTTGNPFSPKKGASFHKKLDISLSAITCRISHLLTCFTQLLVLFLSPTRRFDSE